MMNYFASIGLVVVIMTILYWLFPKYFGPKNEYLTYLLCSISSFWVLYMLSRIWTDELFNSPSLSFYLLFVWCTLSHLIYPFKKVKRNRDFTLITVGFTSISIFLALLAWLLVNITDTM